MSNLILVETTGVVTTLTLNRPERHNSLIPELLGDLLAALENLAAQPDLRVVVLRANGPSFSTGGDVRAFANHKKEVAAYAKEIVGLLNQVMLAFINFPTPIVTAVHGLVTGGSLGLVLASDIVLVTPNTIFQPYYTIVGFSPDGGWTALLPQVIGLRRAAEIQYLNQPITAEQSVMWGLANRLVPSELLEQEALAIANGIAEQVPGSVRRTKQLLWQGASDLAARLEAERQHFVQQIVTAEAQAGMADFLSRIK